MKFRDKDKEDVSVVFILKYTIKISYAIIDFLINDLKKRNEYYIKVDEFLEKYEMEYTSAVFMSALQFFIWSFIFGVGFFGNIVAATLATILRIWMYKKFDI